MRIIRSILVLVTAMVPLLLACAPTGGTGKPTVTGIWARPSTSMGGMAGGGQFTSAVYLTIHGGNSADKLTAAKSDAAKTVELHQTAMENNVAKMGPVAAIDIPANGTVELKPGGYHIMLIEPVRELKPGDSINVTLVFEKAGEIPVRAEVRATT